MVYFDLFKSTEYIESLKSNGLPGKLDYNLATSSLQSCGKTKQLKVGNNGSILIILFWLDLNGCFFIKKLL